MTHTSTSPLLLIIPYTCTYFPTYKLISLHAHAHAHAHIAHIHINMHMFTCLRGRVTGLRVGEDDLVAKQPPSLERYLQPAVTVEEAPALHIA